MSQRNAFLQTSSFHFRHLREKTRAISSFELEFSQTVDQLTQSTLEKLPPECWPGNYSHMQPTAQNTSSPNYERGTDSEQIIHENSPVNIFPSPWNRCFACPFYIHQPDRFMRCLTGADLRDIEDVKQHLWDAHLLPSYCPVCGEVFATETSCVSHIQRRCCTPREAPLPEGITMQQVQQLAWCPEPWMSRELQWLCVWEIVFPQSELPVISYPSRPVDFAVCRCREYWESHGKGIVSDFLEQRGLRDSKRGDDEGDLEALCAAVLSGVIDHLVGNPES